MERQLAMQTNLRSLGLSLAALLIFLFSPSPVLPQLTTIRIGTNAGATTEAVLFSVFKDAGILKQNQMELEVIFIAGGTLSRRSRWAVFNGLYRR